MSKGTCTIVSTQKDMSTVSVVRRNLMTEPGYSPYCGAMCRVMPRTRFNGEQFVCPCCGWVSSFPKEFIDEYKKKWGLDKKALNMKAVIEEIYKRQEYGTDRRAT